ncbi:hypothetical protein NVIE_018200 [Nitrososphaera viennensis EN76]|uniref:Uncharacterized protein n=1 Tax=Nitrososphaera viennensis EN76 TaxID=926571 RepID=A0A060HSD8_9ARCH|nr:hypothetical protein NVIE_018200 [Nitrososphaera viennensis EN76]
MSKRLAELGIAGSNPALRTIFTLKSLAIVNPKVALASLLPLQNMMLQQIMAAVLQRPVYDY